MCIICFKPSGAPLPSREILENCFYNNPDGAGYAIIRNGEKKVYYSKGFFDFEAFYNVLLSEKIKTSDIVGLHFRIATNGAIEEKNCHPFYVSENRESVYSVEGTCKSILFHNGVLSKKYSFDKKVSDTFLFTLELAKKEKSLIAKGKLSDFIAKETEGNRILYFHTDLKEGFIKSGNWIEDKETGCFFSNNSYSYSTIKWDYEPIPVSSFWDTKKSKFDDFVNMCPYCGETVKISHISQLYDLWECAECGELFDSYGNYVEVVREG